MESLVNLVGRMLRRCLLILLHSRQYRRTHIEAFGKASSWTRVQGVMFMLVESGILYALFFVRIRRALPIPTSLNGSTSVGTNYRKSRYSERQHQ